MAEKELHKLFALMARFNASDLHLKAGAKPILRVSGAIRELEAKQLGPDEVQALIFEILTDVQQRTFRENHDLDFAYSLPGVGRFRINVFMQRGTPSMAARRVQVDIPTFRELNLPPVLTRLSSYQQGLVLICGITGSGKSTTLASMIQHINKTRRAHVITIEDPIEYLYRDDKAFINQREVGLDVPDFRTALKYVVRQDPDVILVGEMRDPETFETGLMAAETGHLVFGTLHSANVAQTMSRVLDMFGSDREELIRQSIAFNMKAIVAQKLLPSILPGVDRVPCCEILIATPTVQKLIREHEDKKLADVLRGTSEEGMQDFTQALVQLIQEKKISKKVGFVHAPFPEQLKMRLQGIYLGDDGRILGT